MFVSYAQNGEDVMLRRALRDVAQGFYVDVGAADPVIDSVSCAFYQDGWRGMNIEPSPEAFAKLAAARPRDINLNVAAGAAEGAVSFYVVDGADVLSTAAPGQREVLRAQGYASREIEVAVRPLAALIAEHKVPAVHFLKVDVEGFERAVLQGAALATFRPWIILVEATAPNSQEPTHSLWEDLLTDAKYRFVWFDGLNRYYIAAEKPELAAAFSVQPNVFDRFTRHSECVARSQLKIAEDRITAQAAQMEELRAYAGQLLARLNGM